MVQRSQRSLHNPLERSLKKRRRKKKKKKKKKEGNKKKKKRKKKKKKEKRKKKKKKKRKKKKKGNPQKRKEKRVRAVTILRPLLLERGSQAIGIHHCVTELRKGGRPILEGKRKV